MAHSAAGSLYGKVVAVTGAGSGIGRSTALLLSKQGAKLSLVDLHKDNLEKTVEALDGDFAADTLTSVVDVCDKTQVENWIQETVAKFGELNCAANIAGVYIPKPLAMSTEADWDLMMNVNAKGVFNCLKSQIPQIKDGGSIVTVASAAGVKGQPTSPIYSASKFAVVGLCASVAGEVGSRNIRVNSVAPGFIDTPMTRSTVPLGPNGERPQASAIPFSRAAHPDEVANVIIYLLGDGPSFVTGACFRVDGGYTI